MILIKGDILEEIKKIKDKSISHTFTSPPYNRKRNDKYTHYDDIKTDYFEWQKECIRQMLRVTSGIVFYNIQANYYNRKDIYRLIGYFNEEIKDIFIWEKTNPMPASGFSITNSVEYFILLSKNKIKSNKTYTKNIIKSSVNSKMPKSHKAVMKQEISDFFIENFTKENDLILDPFMGVGTTGSSCLKLNRKFYGIELIEEYFKIAKNNLTNKIT